MRLVKIGIRAHPQIYEQKQNVDQEINAYSEEMNTPKGLFVNKEIEASEQSPKRPKEEILTNDEVCNVFFACPEEIFVANENPGEQVGKWGD
jgi:hypothetical protein